MIEKTIPVVVSSPAPAVAVRPRILLFDDDPALRKLLRRLLGKEGYEVREASDCDAALAELRSAKMDLAVVNLNAADEGERAVRALLSADAELTIVVCFEAVDLREKSENMLILPRPSRPMTVVSAVAQALGDAARAESRRLPASCQTLKSC